MKLARVDRVLEPPRPGVRGVCPDDGCGARVRAKCGDYLEWHWAHFPREMSPDCAYRFYGEGDWHKHWKSFAPPANREVLVGNFRADMRSSGGFVLEVQASSIASADVRRREMAYETMAWVIDYRSRSAAFVDSARYRERFGDDPEKPEPVFRIEHGWDASARTAPIGRVILPRGSWGGVSRAPAFLDMGATNPAVIRLDRRVGINRGVGRGFAVNRSWLQELVARVMHDQVDPPPILTDRSWDGVMPSDYSPQHANRTSDRRAA